MSESASTHSQTKTNTESDVSASTEESEPDRWTNNITYSQLVASSCIGILQLWWHPYLHELRLLLPFVLLSSFFSLLLGYPLLYLELALGAVSRQSALRCWDMAPIARGVGVSMLVSCACAALATGAACAWSLALLAHAAHAFPAWLHCAAAVAAPCAARHRPLPPGTDTPAQSFFFNFVLDLKRDGLRGGLGSVVPELTVYYVISWALIYLVACKRIYSYSKMVLFKDVMTFLVLCCCCAGVCRLRGAGRMFAEFRWTTLLESLQLWREALEFSLLQLSLSQGTLIMLGSMAPRQPLSRPAALTFLASRLACTASALALGAVHGALHYDYGTENTNLMKGPAASLVLWAELSARLAGGQVWAALIFLTLFTLAVSHTALLVQTLLSCCAGALRRVRWALLLLVCGLFCFTGVLTLCTQGGLYVVDFVLTWCARARPLLGAAAACAGAGVWSQRRFCEDVYFATAEYPCAACRVAWALAPPVLVLFFVSGAWHGAGAGWALVGATLLPAALLALIYLVFKFRVRDIVSEEK